MDVYTAIVTRKSVRAFQDGEVPEELLLRLLEAARLAPSACNFQEWRFVVVRNPETRKRLAMAANRQMFRGWDKISSLLYFHNLLILFEKIFQMSRLFNPTPLIGEAPVLIVCCAETDGHVMACGQQCYPIDVAIAIDHLTLCAAAEGLGTCWIGAFDEGKVKEILDIPKQIRVVELLPLGYPRDPSSVKKFRLPLEKIVKYEQW